MTRGIKPIRLLFAGVIGLVTLQAQTLSASAASVLLSTLTGGASLSVDGLTFSAFDSFLSTSQQSLIAVDAFQAGPNDIALRIRAPDPSKNPYAINKQTCAVASCPTTLNTEYLSYTVTSSGGPVSSSLMFASFIQNIGGDSFYNDATVTKTGPHGLDVIANCGKVSSLDCNQLTATGYQNVNLGTAFDIQDGINLSYSGSLLATGYRIGVSAMEQHFLLNGTTVVASASGPTGGAILSDGSLVLFPVPEPWSAGLFVMAVAGLVGLRRLGGKAPAAAV